MEYLLDIKVKIDIVYISHKPEKYILLKISILISSIYIIKKL